MEIVTNEKKSPATPINEPKIVPISPDIGDYSLLDKNKVEIIQPKKVIKSTEETMNNLLYKENDQYTLKVLGEIQTRMILHISWSLRISLASVSQNN